MLRKKDAEAKALLKQVAEKTLEILAASAEDQSVGAIAKAAKVQAVNASRVSETPSIEFRMQTCRFLIELCMWRPSMQLLEGIVAEDDENVEAWYLLAFSLFRLKKYATAEECCSNVRNLILKFKIVDPDLESGPLEIYNEIQSWKAKKQPIQNKEDEDIDGEDWATESEEAVDADDDDEEMKE